MKIAVQLYSVRDDAERDLQGTLTKLRSLGYEGVELAGLYGHTPEEIREICQAADIIPISAHIKCRAMLEDPHAALAPYAAIGCKYVALSSISTELRPGNPLFETVPARLTEWGRLAAELGMHLLYHNHDFEFYRIGGQAALDVMYESTPAELLGTELDVCWIRAAGSDPEAYIRKYAGRCPVVHLKDFTGERINPIGLSIPDGEAPKRPENMKYLNLGRGEVDVDAVLRAAKESGTEWLVVEQDQPTALMSPLQSVSESRKHLVFKGFPIVLPEAAPKPPIGWLFEDIPAYTDVDAVCSKKLYPCGMSVLEQGEEHSAEEEPQMQTVTRTTRAAYLSYLKTLEQNGFEQAYCNDLDGNLFAAHVGEKAVLYSGYFAYTDRTFFVREDRARAVLPSEFGYAYTKKSGDPETLLYQYGSSMDGSGWGPWKNPDRMLNCGMFYFLRCADNSLIVIDGSSYHQFNDTTIDETYSLMRELTGTAEGERMRISAWIITHRHVDHFMGFCRVLDKYRDSFSLERIAANYPTLHLPDRIPPNNLYEAAMMARFVRKYYPACREIKLHCGQRLQIADVTLDFLHTHEQEVDTNGDSTVNSYFNATTLVFRVTVNGKSVMFLGDLAKERPEYFMILNYTDRFLKSDAVQISHHMWNRHMRIYSAIGAPVALFPQSAGGARKDAIRREMLEHIRKYAGEECYYEGEETTGFAFREEGVVAVDHRPFTAVPYDGWYPLYRKEEP